MEPCERDKGVRESHATKRALGALTLLCLILCVLLAGCGKSGAADGGSGQAASNSQAATDTWQSVETERVSMTASYTTRELWVQNGDLKIYGIAYVPDDSEKAPLAVFSHELGNDHTSGERYAERLAQSGYAVYVFDFCGGTVGGNRSDGSNAEMSVLTEASDLEAVLRAARTWDFVDADRIVLMGGSMGGLVTTIVGSSHQDKIAGMILIYPALSVKEDSKTSSYRTERDVPDDVSLFGGWIHVGKNFITDLWKIDFDQLLTSYKGRMLLLHGDKDATVPISWSEDAAKIIPTCEFHMIEGGGHKFFGQPFEDAMSYILAYLNNQLRVGNSE